MAKDNSYAHESYLDWIRKIAKKDKLKSDKCEAIRYAIHLCYGKETLERILKATSEMQIYMALRNAREIA